MFKRLSTCLPGALRGVGVGVSTLWYVHEGIHYSYTPSPKAALYTQVDARLGSIDCRFFSLCDGNDWLSPHDLLQKILYFRKTPYSPVTYV